MLLHRMAPMMWSNNRTSLTNNYSTLAAKYKRLKTGTLDPHLTNAQNYSQLARHSMIFRRYPIIGLKNPITGTADVVINANIKQLFIKQRLTTKIFCIQYIQ